MTPISYDGTAFLRLSTLTGLRWFAVFGQFIVLIAVRYGFGFEVELGPVLALVAAGGGWLVTAPVTPIEPALSVAES